MSRINLGVNHLLSANKLDYKKIDLVIGSNILCNEPPINNFININHHLAHAACAFFQSPFEKAAILVIDGSGNKIDNNLETVSLYFGSGNKIELLYKVNGVINHNTNTIIALSNSLGVLYQNASAVCGFGPLGAGKLMGLAPYGKPVYAKQIEQYIGFYKDSATIDNIKIYNFLESIRSENFSFDKKANLAASIQRITNKIFLHYSKILYEMTGCSNLCIAGGVGLNAISNSYVLKHSDFSELYIPSAPGDNGISVGAALYGYYCILKNERKINNWASPYLGKLYSDDEIKQALINFKKFISYAAVGDKIYDLTTTLLQNGKVVAWFQGRSEFGPRALGNRSIIANPSKPNIKDHLNKIKSREWFRPVAPVILEHEVEHYYSIPKSNHNISYPYMIFIFKIKDRKLKQIMQGAIHVDDSSRIQTLSKTQNEKFYYLLENFYYKTGIPLLINTSFNARGEPIVETPEDALLSFLKLNIDYLVIDNYLIKKKRPCCESIKKL